MAYDVIIIGGALSGASVATLLLRDEPALRVLIVEKSERFTRKVGEATVEISGLFLSRVLGLGSFLAETQLPKQGLRFWFANERVTSLPEASEIGPRYQVRLPSYQCDRAVLDEEVLRRAVAAGAELRRPASVARVELNSGGRQRVTLRTGDATETLEARWVVDASGPATVIARQEGWREMNTEHPTASAWGRWRGVKDWDGLELAAKYPEWARACHTTRNTATNHIVGDGWWSWWIPLKGGDVSIGVVFDQRLVDWPAGGSLGERLKTFLLRHPVAREMLADAELVEGDINWRKNLAYCSRTFAGDGFVLVGDAGSFLDPLYSPGMDWIAAGATSAAKLIRAQRRGEALAPLIDDYNARFRTGYRRAFEALYRDKYEYLGEFDLVRIAFLLDLGLYYLGVVHSPYVQGPHTLVDPPFGVPAARPAHWLMRLYNRRLATIARHRRATGQLGRTNDRRRLLTNSYTLDRRDARLLLKPLRAWLALELREGWRTWFAPRDLQGPSSLAAPSPAT